MLTTRGEKPEISMTLEFFSFFRSAAPVSSAGVRLGVRPDVQPDVRAAPVSSEGEKKNAGGPGGGSPPAKPVKGGVWGGFAPPAKIWGVWGAAPPSQKYFENF